MIPDFQTCMLPLLNATSDGNTHTLKEAVEIIANKFNLSDDERNAKISSGQSIIGNRVGWACTYLKKAGLLIAPKRGLFQITERGREELQSNPKLINIKYLEKYDEFRAFRIKKEENKIDAEEKESVVCQNNITPEEAIAFGYSTLNQVVSEEILKRIRECSSEFFEKLVVELLVKMGYGGTLKEAGKVVGKSGDGGIDGIINEDKLGLDVIYIQAKRWENVVGRPEIQQFAGALLKPKAKKGVFITTSRYTKEALAFVENLDLKIILIDGEMLAELMLEYNLGVSTYKNYELKKIDNDYFEDENL